VTTVSAAARDKSFVTTGADGSVVLRHLTAQRTIVELPKQPAPVAAAVISPKNDGILVVLENGTLSRFSVASPHPETTLRTLFGRVWYEGYPRPEFVWQSTGATDDFESKLSLVPLIFGTIKATVYALLFAIPLGVLGALYTSQFVHPASGRRSSRRSKSWRRFRASSSAFSPGCGWPASSNGTWSP